MELEKGAFCPNNMKNNLASLIKKRTGSTVHKMKKMSVSLSWGLFISASCFLRHIKIVFISYLKLVRCVQTLTG